MTWSNAALERIQDLLDRSLEGAGAVQSSFYGKPERRLHAAEFLTTWNSIYMCAVASHGTTQWPHVASIKLLFDDDAELVTLVYEGSVRHRDLQASPRMALQKHRDDGTMLTCYAQVRDVLSEPTVDARGRSSVRVALTPVRLFGIGPYVTGPLAVAST